MSVKTCACGRTFSARGRQTRCDWCRAADPHRNGHRRNRHPQMFVSVDSETEWDPIAGRQRFVTLSYGREDGSSASMHGHDGAQLFLWLMSELCGPYTDPNGKVWKQTAVAFHFGHDTAVFGNDLDLSRMFLIRKAQAKIKTALCGADHSKGSSCEYDTRVDPESGVPVDGALHRYDPGDIEAVITDGMLSDVIAYHRDTHLAFAMSTGQGFYLEHRPAGDRYEGWRRLIIRDTGRAFIGGLETVIDHWNPVLTERQREVIAWGKASRGGGFTGADPTLIAEYSEAECVAHARVCRKLLDSIAAAAHVPMRPDQLAGSGTVAAATMKHYGVPRRRETHVDERRDALAPQTYYGGLIEAPVVGRLTEPVDGADINSAYPSKMIHMPCMRQDHGEWKVSRGRLPDGAIIGHALVTWDVRRHKTSTPPFTVRRKSGAVTQPLIGLRTWVALPELQAALSRFGHDIVVHRVEYWSPTCECPEPLAFLADLYDARAALKDQMRTVPEGSADWWELSCKEQAVKLIINSIYGKLAQCKHGYGPYTNLHYASFITGSTRGQVRLRTWEYETAGGTIVYQHTDSVLSVGCAVVDEGKKLGAWGKEKQSHGFLIIQPGLAMSLDGGKKASRGVRMADFIPAAIAWYENNDLTQHPDTWSRLRTEQTVMVSRRLAIARGKPRLAGSFEAKVTESQVTSNKRDYDQAYQVPGNPEAWAVPPTVFVHDQATVGDLKDHKSRLDKRRQAGEFDQDE